MPNSAIELGSGTAPLLIPTPGVVSQ